MTVSVLQDDNSRDAIKERHLKHIAEISENLKPIQLEHLTPDQQDFLNRTGRYTPYRSEPQTQEGVDTTS